MIAFRGHSKDDHVYYGGAISRILSVEDMELTPNSHWGMLARCGFSEICNHGAALLNQPCKASSMFIYI